MVGHHHKGEQAPPAGFGGKRFRPSLNYFSRPVGQLREQARAERSRAMALLRLADLHGEVLLELAGDTIDNLVDELLDGPRPELVHVAELPTSWDDDGMPAAMELQVLGPVRG
jgi:hypothetical protein